MTNKEIAVYFKDLAQVMEYLGEDSFRIRSYSKANDLLRKLDAPVADLSPKELQEYDGVGKAISEKIVRIVAEGRLEQLDKLKADLPDGVADLLQVRGLGPKKVRQLVSELEVNSIDDLLDAALENRVVDLKGWSDKSQQKLQEQLEFYLSAQGLVRYADAEKKALPFLTQLKAAAQRAEITGEFARQSTIISELTFVATPDSEAFLASQKFKLVGQSMVGAIAGLACRVLFASDEAFAKTALLASCSPEFLALHPTLSHAPDAADAGTVLAKADMPFVPAPQREAESPYPPVAAGELVQAADIQGVVHTHTKWSDGGTTTEVLAQACKDAGYKYLVISDHSKSAGYANGLSTARLKKQAAEIDALNAAMSDFHIFKSVECDILRDGQLDYDAKVLRELDLVIASVHSVLRMDIDDATNRVVTAINTGLVDILGHPTGRLLLSRAGYPLHWHQVFEACAKHGTAIELNASPHRLDLDWTLIPQALDHGLKISINPDAHSLGGLKDIRFGVLAAQKGGLRKTECLNTLSTDEFSKWLKVRQQR